MSRKPPTTPYADSDLGYYAKSDDLGALDPEHPINVRLRAAGGGVVANVLETDLAARTIRISASAIGGAILVALGWHVNDDRRRTLVLDPEGKIQINLSLISNEGRSIDQILGDIQEEAVQSWCGPKFLRFEYRGIQALAVQGIVLNEERIEQTHMLMSWAKDSATLRARVTADPQSTRFAVQYAGLILKSVEYPAAQGEPVAPARKRHDSFYDGRLLVQAFNAWERARQLECEDRLEEAEQLIRATNPTLSCAIQIAELYRNRWIRLRESDPAKAGEARKQAADWARTYASWATSGGEGAALSRERDEFLKLLGPEPL